MTTEDVTHETEGLHRIKSVISRRPSSGGSGVERETERPGYNAVPLGPQSGGNDGIPYGT